MTDYNDLKLLVDATHLLDLVSGKSEKFGYQSFTMCFAADDMRKHLITLLQSGAYSLLNNNLSFIMSNKSTRIPVNSPVMELDLTLTGEYVSVGSGDKTIIVAPCTFTGNLSDTISNRLAGLSKIFLATDIFIILHQHKHPEILCSTKIFNDLKKQMSGTANGTAHRITSTKSLIAV